MDSHARAPDHRPFADRYGPWAVIAGASEGTGRAFAHRAAAQGLNCVLLARRAPPLDLLARELRSAHGVECVTASVDLAADDAVQQTLSAAGDRDVGLFIANAGGDTHGALFLDQPVDAWLGLARRNVLTTLALCHHFAGPMRRRGRGGLLLVNSGACYGGASYQAVYSATKAFMLCFAESLWAELQPCGIDVLSLVLGQTDTPAFRTLLAEKGMPVPATLAAPDDVARTGFERLAHGPVHNWGLDDDAAGYAPRRPRPDASGCGRSTASAAGCLREVRRAPTPDHRAEHRPLRGTREGHARMRRRPR